MIYFNTELQIFHLSRYSVHPRRFYRGKGDTYDKETMLKHSYKLNYTSYKKYIFSIKFFNEKNIIDWTI